TRSRTACSARCASCGSPAPAAAGTHSPRWRTAADRRPRRPRPRREVWGMRGFSFPEGGPQEGSLKGKVQTYSYCRRYYQEDKNYYRITRSRSIQRKSLTRRSNSRKSEYVCARRRKPMKTPPPPAALFVATDLDHFEADAGGTDPDVARGGRTYRRLDPAYFAWLWHAMTRARAAADAGAAPPADYQELRHRFNCGYFRAARPFGPQAPL